MKPLHAVTLASVGLFIALMPCYAQQEQAAASTQDVIFRHGGASLTGRVLGVESENLRVEVVLREGQPAASVTIPLRDIDRVEFYQSTEEREILELAQRENLAPLTALWREKQEYLALANSNAGLVAVRLGQVLLMTQLEADYARALELFQVAEEKTWDPEVAQQARRGRLRSMILLGRGDEIIDEARALAAQEDDPAVVIEARLVLAQAAFADLKELEEEHPRWEEDILVRPRRHALVAEALDLYLFPYLFHGANEEAATQGLMGAIELCQFLGREKHARALAQDLVLLYPNNPRGEELKALLETDESEEAVEQDEL
ncbi:MAG: hypothetical protein ACFCU3_01870 [Verrucomicrobiales bacterium]